MHNTLENLQNNCPICRIQTNLRASDDARLNKEAQRIAISIYKNKWNGKFDQKLTKLVAEKLLHFYTQGLADIGTALPEPIAQSLQDNIYHFAGAKNYQQLKTLSQAVYNPQTGTKIPFAQFKEVAKKIDEKYNKIWLKTEQNHAYASTQMAAKWNSFDEAFHLKYKTAGDGRVRPSHAALNNITKPKNDSFWNKYYPPNDYGCRCNVIETNDEKTTDTAHIPENTVPKMFQVNTAKENIVFPLSHPYFKGVPKEIEKSAKFLRTKEQNVISPEELKASRQEAIKIGKEKFAGKSFTTKDGNKVNMYGADIKSIVGKTHDNVLEKNALVAELDKVLQTSTLIKSAHEMKDRTQYQTWYYYQYKKGFYLNVVKMAAGEFRLHSISDSLK